MGSVRGGAPRARLRLLPACRPLFASGTGGAGFVPPPLRRTECRRCHGRRLQLRHPGDRRGGGRALQLRPGSRSCHGAGPRHRGGVPRAPRSDRRRGDAVRGRSSCDRVADHWRAQRRAGGAQRPLVRACDPGGLLGGDESERLHPRGRADTRLIDGARPLVPARNPLRLVHQVRGGSGDSVDLNHFLV